MHRPRPVVTTSSLVGIITAVALVLGTLGFTSAETKLSGEAQALAAAIIGVVTLASHLYAAFHAQEKVTPNSDPQDLLGRSLRAVDGLQATAQSVSSELGIGNRDAGLVHRLFGVVDRLLEHVERVHYGTLSALQSAHGEVSTLGTEFETLVQSAKGESNPLTGDYDHFGAAAAAIDSDDGPAPPEREGSAHGGLSTPDAERSPAPSYPASAEAAPAVEVPAVAAPPSPPRPSPLVTGTLAPEQTGAPEDPPRHAAP